MIISFFVTKDNIDLQFIRTIFNFIYENVSSNK